MPASKLCWWWLDKSHFSQSYGTTFIAPSASFQGNSGIVWHGYASGFESHVHWKALILFPKFSEKQEEWSRYKSQLHLLVLYMTRSWLTKMKGGWPRNRKTASNKKLRRGCLSFSCCWSDLGSGSKWQANEQQFCMQTGMMSVFPCSWLLLVLWCAGKTNFCCLVFELASQEKLWKMKIRFIYPNFQKIHIVFINMPGLHFSVHIN